MQVESAVALGEKLNTVTRLLSEAIGIVVAEGVPGTDQGRSEFRSQLAQIEEAARATKGAFEAQDTLEVRQQLNRGTV